LRQLSTAPYEEVAFHVMQPFVADSVPEDEFRQITAEAYAGFRHPAVTPLKQLDDSLWLQELFHGPTLAFKDVAMQLLARLMDRALEKRGAHATIVGATSGDTGGAAIEAFKSSRNASIFILHPHGRVSDVQRRQMTTVDAAHVHNIALDGTFDDCQAIVKALFNDPKFREKQRLSGVNSINWARIMAQMVYYFTAALALGAPGRSVSFTVPTGNFGNVFAGFSAKRLGLPIDKLVIATNPNDILDRTLKTGRYEVKGVKPSTSPSMDIQVSSNFERLVYFACEHDVNRVRNLMESLRQSGSFTLQDRPLEAVRAEFSSTAQSEAQTAEVIRNTLKETGELLDPHSAVAVGAARENLGETPMVALATAHPAKFPDAVFEACGLTPGLPEALKHLNSAKERYTVLPNDAAAVKQFIAERTR
ncbi:MAG: threonine synthase, partial [Rhizobiales bacterium]|nr:threonine synthase [Hyphomicrobiales bacterium]